MGGTRYWTMEVCRGQATTDPRTCANVRPFTMRRHAPLRGPTVAFALTTAHFNSTGVYIPYIREFTGALRVRRHCYADARPRPHNVSSTVRFLSRLFSFLFTRDLLRTVYPVTVYRSRIKKKKRKKERREKMKRKKRRISAASRSENVDGAISGTKLDKLAIITRAKCTEMSTKSIANQSRLPFTSVGRRPVNRLINRRKSNQESRLGSRTYVIIINGCSNIFGYASG